MKNLVLLPILATLAISTASQAATRDMENLDRGVVAVKVSNGVFVGWRVLGTDPANLAFNVYRGATKVNDAPITGATNLVDAAGTASSVYSVRPVVGGAEQVAAGEASVWASQTLKIALDRPVGGTLENTAYTYSPSDIAVGDLDGDGQWDLVVKWDPSNAKDNSQAGLTGNVYLDAYTLKGKKLWRIDLGVNIRAGAHYTQMLVGDYDSDGKAEIACKTAPGTKDGSNAYLSKGPASSDDDSKVYRNAEGRINAGPEYLTIFNGLTGKEMSTVAYVPRRHPTAPDNATGAQLKAIWGDDYGGRFDRFLATNAYLDGKKPSMVFQDGYYTRMALAAWDWDGKTLSQRWLFDTYTGDAKFKGQGNHNLSAGDVDGDGFDEIIEGASAIDHDGKGMYVTGLGHGDAIHFGDLDPDNPGLEVWEVHEDTAVAYGHELHDAKTGKILWGQNFASDNGRGMAADIDATSAGHEMWSSAGAGIYSAKGKQVSTAKPSVNFRVYWDGDLQDELLDGNKLDKWNGSGSTRLITLEGTSCNGTKATPNFSGDLLGDWREEVILHDDANLYLTTTTATTNHRLYTLAHDPVYRLAMSWQNGAYNQPPHLGFWLGAGVDKAPKPDIKLVGGGAAAIGSRDPFAQAGSGISAKRVGSKISIQGSWKEPATVRIVALDGRILSVQDVGSAATLDLDAPAGGFGMLVVSFRFASGRVENAVVAGF